MASSGPSINLLSILEATKQGISEDQAWAIAFQAAITAEKCIDSDSTVDSIVEGFYTIDDASLLWLNRDGTVDPKSFRIQQGNMTDVSRSFYCYYLFLDFLFFLFFIDNQKPFVYDADCHQKVRFSLD